MLSRCAYIESASKFRYLTLKLVLKPGKELVMKREEIIRLFPEINDIQDENLRNGVIKVWIYFWEKSGFENLEEAPFNPVVPGVSLVNHIKSVLHISLAIAEALERYHGIKVNRDRLIAAVLLHDVSKTVEYEHGKKSEIGKLFQHGFWGAHEAINFGLPVEIAHLIHTHPFNSPVEPAFLEGLILHYADFADADSLRFNEGVEPYLFKK